MSLLILAFFPVPRALHVDRLRFARMSYALALRDVIRLRMLIDVSGAIFKRGRRLPSEVGLCYVGHFVVADCLGAVVFTGLMGCIS